MNRGMTLLEVLLALSLLGVLAIASAGLVQMAAACGTQTSQDRGWQPAAAGTLDAIERDLDNGDVALEPDPRRVTARKLTLVISTRSAADGRARGGPVVHEYRFDPARSELWRDERDIDPARGPGPLRRTRILLGGVQDWSAVIHQETGTLEVSLKGPDKCRLQRRFSIR